MPPFNLAFFTHIILESGAACAFFRNPSFTLAQPQPHAHQVIRQYALLLISTNLIAANFLFQQQPSALSSRVAGALALYHLGPITRAALKISSGEERGSRKGELLGGAWLQASFHIIMLVMLVLEASKVFWFA